MELLRSAGYRITPHRRILYNILQHSDIHLDADELFRQAKAIDPHISLATVYRTLALFKELGIVSEHRLGQDHGHYEAAQPMPHFHFTCQRCGRIIEFNAPQVLTAARQFSQREGARVEEIHLHLSGLCSACQSIITP